MSKQGHLSLRPDEASFKEKYTQRLVNMNLSVTKWKFWESIGESNCCYKSTGIEMKV